jgi:hypothetical protein
MARHLTQPELDAIGRRGEEIYEQSIRRQIEDGNLGKFVAIDINSGEYEVGADHLETVNRLHSRRQNAEVYTIKIGYPATAVIGGSLRPTAKAVKQ